MATEKKDYWIERCNSLEKQLEEKTFDKIIKDLIKEYIRTHLEIRVENHYSDGYGDSNYIKIQLVLDGEVISDESARVD